MDMYGQQVGLDNVIYLGLDIYPCMPRENRRLEEDTHGSFQLEGPACNVNVALSAGVWEHLPEELVESLLLLLPFESQVRFRSVSKQWSALLSSQSFLRKSAALRPLPLCCTNLSLSDRHYSIGDGEGGPRFFLDLSHLPPPFGRAETAAVVLVQDGLILLGKRSRYCIYDIDANYCVANPLDTKAWRVLPPFCSSKLGSVAGEKMEVAPDCSSFQVFLQVRPADEWTSDVEFYLVVYSSITDCWEPTHLAWQGARASWLVTKGILYLQDPIEDTLRLVNMENGGILKVAPFGIPRDLPSWKFLLGHKGDAYVAKEACIWKLDGTTWVLIAEVPASLLTLANQAKGYDWRGMFKYSSREGDHICLCFFYGQSWQIIAFHIPSATWQASPEISNWESDRIRGLQLHARFQRSP